MFKLKEYCSSHVLHYLVDLAVMSVMASVLIVKILLVAS